MGSTSEGPLARQGHAADCSGPARWEELSAGLAPWLACLARREEMAGELAGCTRDMDEVVADLGELHRSLCKPGLASQDRLRQEANFQARLRQAQDRLGGGIRSLRAGAGERAQETELHAVVQALLLFLAGVVGVLGTGSAWRVRRSQQHLVEQQRQRARLTETNPCILYLFDLVGRRLTWVNARVQAVLGYSPQQYVAMEERVFDLIHPEDQAAVDSAIEQVMAAPDGATVQVEFRVRHADGSWRWLRDWAVVFRRDEQGRPVEVLGSLEDVTPYKEAEAALRRARDELEGQVRQRTAELAASEARFRRLADAMPQIVWTSSPDGSTDYCNRRWYDYTGFNEKEPPATSWTRIIHPEDLPSCYTAWQQAVNDQTSFYLECRFLDRHTGGWRWHLVRAVPERDASGRVVRWYGTSTDIDDQKKVEEALERLRDHLEERVRERVDELARSRESLEREIAVRRRTEADLRRAQEVAEAAARTRREFLANMSHEICTPMHGVLGMIDVVLQGPLSEEQRAQLRTAHSVGEVLVRLLTDILDLASAEAGQLALRRESFDLPQALDDVLRLVTPEASGKALAVRAEIGEGVPGLVLGDAARLRQVLVNLVGNAVKFTEQGEVVVAVKAEEPDAKAQRRKEESREHEADGPSPSSLCVFAPLREALLHFSVRDTGPGIPACLQAAIFEPFRQADGSSTRRHGGAGLGLTVAARLVALMGGQLHLESQPGAGSTFSFSLTLSLPTSPVTNGPPARISG